LYCFIPGRRCSISRWMRGAVSSFLSIFTHITDSAPCNLIPDYVYIRQEGACRVVSKAFIHQSSTLQSYKHQNHHNSLETRSGDRILTYGIAPRRMSEVLPNDSRGLNLYNLCMSTTLIVSKIPRQLVPTVGPTAFRSTRSSAACDKINCGVSTATPGQVFHFGSLNFIPDLPVNCGYTTRR
jgi:hypothetical protein